MFRRPHLGLFEGFWKQPKTFTVQKALYARNNKQHRHQNERFIDSADAWPDDENLEKVQDGMDDWLDISHLKKMDDVERDEKISKQKLVKQIIRRKFFKPTQEINLLTWDAKEQIRYLHQEYPEEWTVDCLSESFPISKSGIVQLLKSRYQPKTYQDLVKHDNRVRMNWKALLGKKKGTPGGPLVSRYEALQAKGQLDLLKNAAGIDSLPKAKWESKLLGALSRTEDEKIAKSPGIFESIVLDYTDQKRQITGRATEGGSDRERLTCHLKENQKLLADVSKKQSRVHLPEQSATLEVNTEVNNAVTDTVTYKNMESLHQNNIGHPASVKDSLHILSNQSSALNQEDPASEKTNAPRTLRKRRTSHKELIRVSGDDQVSHTSSTCKNNLKAEANNNMNKEALQDEKHINIGMLGTYKKATEDLAGDVHSAAPNINDEMEEKQSIMDGVRSEPDKEPYIFDPDKGYQYPFGQVDKSLNKNLPAKLKAQHKHSHDTVVYQAGKDFYDEDGDFLYRIP